jgi:hypothetical protein
VIVRATQLATVALLAAVALGFAVAGPGAGTADAARAHTSAPPAHLLVYAQEWSLWPSRTRIPAGTIDVELWNRGQDAHDLRVRALNSHGRMTGRVLGRVGITQSGGLHNATWHLRAAHYELYCSMPGHLKMGMHTRITVVS